MKPSLPLLATFILGIISAVAFTQINFGGSDALALVGGAFATPESFTAQATQRRSANPETSSRVAYAIPEDMEMYQLIGQNYANSSIESSIMMGTLRTAPVFQDLNGDGLADMVFAKRGTYTNLNLKIDYVLINNGRGYDLAYYCRRDPNNSTPDQRYQGDCAAN